MANVQGQGTNEMANANEMANVQGQGTNEMANVTTGGKSKRRRKQCINRTKKVKDKN